MIRRCLAKKMKVPLERHSNTRVKFVHKPDQWQEPNSKFNTRLNELGADGWELVTANEHIDSRGISVATTFYFKREIETAPPN